MDFLLFTFGVSIHIYRFVCILFFNCVSRSQHKQMFYVTVGVSRHRTHYFLCSWWLHWLIDWVACRQFRYVRAGRGWQVQVKYYVRRPMVNFLVKVKKLRAGKKANCISYLISEMCEEFTRFDYSQFVYFRKYSE